jgi:arylsulfatase A-like enzyme
MLASLTTACFCLFNVAASPAAEKPNIVLAMADDQGWGDMAYNGHAVLKTPNFDQMAASGLRFDRFYAAAPVCSPTRGSVMTGRHPNRFGCFKWGHTLRPQEVTVAEALKQAGYTTGHFGKWHLGSVRPGSPVNPGASGFDEWFSAPNFFDNHPILSDKGKAIQTKGESSMVTVDAALAFMRRCVAEKQRFFAVVWFGSPHGPHEALEEDLRLYADHPKAFQHFYGEITAMDRAFGKLRDELDRLGIRDDTILWYCSDNGALRKVGSSGGHRGNKGQVYDGGLMVPAILEWPPRIPEPRTSDVRCNTSDIYPTLLEIAGVNVEHQPPLDGISLLPLIEGRMTERPRPMGFWDYPASGVGTPAKQWMTELLTAQSAGGEPKDTWKLRLDAGEITKRYPETELPGHAAWIDGDWKFHRIADKSGTKVRFELYNLAEDREEADDLYARESARAQGMKSSLEAWQRSVVRSLNGEDY